MFNKVKDKFYNNPDKIRELLEDIGCLKIKLIKDNFKFALDDEGSFSGNGNTLNVNTLKYVSYSHNYKGDIVSLVSHKLNIELGDSLRYLCRFLNIDWDYTSNSKIITPPFGGFYLNFKKVQEDDGINTLVYPVNELNKYQKGSTILWTEDNIDCQTQEYFNICYDSYSNRILTPWITLEGELGGLIGRINERELRDGVLKYVSMIPMNKSMMLFGLYQHYNDIQEQGVCFIFEAEKSTMQLHSYGIKTGVSLGCKTITPKQVSLLKSLCVDIILCLDSDVNEEYIKEECNKLKVSNPFFINKVGYIYDKEEKYLKKKDKVSPTDLGYEIFCKVLGECLYWVE